MLHLTVAHHTMVSKV